LRLYFRADAAFASPDVYEYLENEGIKYAIRLPTNPILQERIAHLLSRPVGRPPNDVRRYYASGREAGPSRAASLPKSNGIRANSIRASASLSRT
jgi:hypothetical protein